MSKKQITSKNEQEFSKYLSYILRHKPDSIGLSLLECGWVDTYKLIEAINSSDKSKFNIDLADLIDVVNNDSERRYSFRENEQNDPYGYIRANQGHSIKGLVMDFKLAENIPEYLYHGTSEENADAIFKSGILKPMSRQMVHLSKNTEKATRVGKRHGELVILKVDTKKAIADGIVFYISENEVYLTNELDTKYLEVLN